MDFTKFVIIGGRVSCLIIAEVYHPAGKKKEINYFDYLKFAAKEDGGYLVFCLRVCNLCN